MDDAKQQVRQAVDIVDLVGDYLPLRRQGRIFVAQCPWHDDSRPSLQVNPERQSWKCWVCDIGGDVFSFVMRKERVEFREALELLADRAGIELQRQPGTPVAAGSIGDKRTQLAALEWVCEQFARCLARDASAAPARNYLTERGLNSSSIERFRLGFSPPDWSWLVERGRAAGYSPELLERVGVVGQRVGGAGWYDRFRGRVIFPIRDSRGRTIAFGGRILPELADERSAKYVNSPETPLYSKSHELFGLDMAREHLGKGDRIIVMEGYTDVIMAHQHGVESAVACCGTALGEGHLKLIRRFTDQICLVLDGDEAGQRRTNEILGLFIANQVDLRILTLPETDDPCDYIRREGGEAFTRLVGTATDALDHKLQHELAKVDSLDNTHIVTQVADELLRTLASVPLAAGESGSQTIIREQQMVTRIARQLRLPELQLRERLNALRKQQTSRVRLVGNTDDDASEMDDAPRASASMTARDKEIIELLLLDHRLVVPIAQVFAASDIRSPLAQQLFERICDLHEQGATPTFERLMLSLDDERVKNLLVAIDESARAKESSDRDQRLSDLVAGRQREQQSQAARASLARLQDDRIDPQDKEQVLAQFFDNLKRHQTGSRSTDGESV